MTFPVIPKKIATWSLFILAGFAVMSGCRKEEFNTDKNYMLKFSSDTVIFDTIFTSVGTTTHVLMVYNSGSLPVKISSIRLAGGSASPFRINIDGEAVSQKSDVEIAAKDSLYIFVKVTIDPNDADGPFIKADSILFETNDNVQDVKLIAWGQNAYFYHDTVLTGNIILKNDKPHVIYGDLIVDSLSSLTIEEGAQLCFHRNSGLIVKNTGKLKVNGTLADPVVFRSDTYVNFDPLHDTVPGMWSGIRLQSGSGRHELNFAEIRNAEAGIVIDSADASLAPVLTLYNCKIRNTVSYGISAVASSVLAANCEFSNCGGFLLAIQQGGNYDFRHCTFANYWQWLRKTPSIYLSNIYYGLLGEKHLQALEKAYFGNCVIYGNYRVDTTRTELTVSEDKSTPFSFTFDHCIIPSGLNKNYPDSFHSCLVREDPLFLDTDHWNYQLDTLSPAKDIGLRSIIDFSSLNLTSDLNGNSRVSDTGPDLGAYERIENR